MADEELDELARTSASTRQFVIAIALAIVLVPLLGWFLGAVVGAPGKVVAGGCVTGLVAAMVIGMSVRTPSHRFPTLVVLRDRPQDVAYIVTIARGKQIIALAGADSELLAKPLVLKGTARMTTARSADGIIAAQSAQMTRALAITARRCPQARTARIADGLGFASFGKLAKKAIAAANQGR
jgi:hypothetical protein